MHCWHGKHNRCTGWLVVPDESKFGRKYRCDQSISCECFTCLHPPVHRFRHLYEQPTRAARGERWNS
jgi:hypothetical protein